MPAMARPMPVQMPMPGPPTDLSRGSDPVRSPASARPDSAAAGDARRAADGAAAGASYAVLNRRR